MTWDTVRRSFVILFALLLGTMVWLFVTHDGEEQFALTTDEVASLLMDTSTIVLDVRTETEYLSDSGHLPGSLNLSVQEFTQRIGELEEYRHRRFVVYCRTQNRSRKAAGLLRTNGYDAKFMMGGMVKWHREGKPVERDSLK